MKAFRLAPALAPSGRTDLGYFLKAGVLTVVYVFFARLGLQIHAINVFATLVWPPTGIALAAILLAGYRFWPAIALGAIAANLWTGAPFLVALGIGVGNTLEALAGAYAVRRIPGFRSSLDRLIDVLGLIALAGVLSPIVSATIGSASLLWGGIVSPDRFAVTWRTWWLGDAIGALIVAPVLLTWTRTRVKRSSPLRLAEACLLAVLLVGTSAFIFEWTADGMAALLSPLLIWAAIRFEQRGAARATLLVCAIAVWATARGHGPFTRQTIEEGLFSLQAFMALTAGTFLVLGVITAERRRSQEDAETANRAKDQFLATLSHELRTPLTPVLALSSLLEKNSGLPEAVRRQLEIVRRNAELEARLIDDLLDLTRISKGKLDVKLEPVDLDQAIEHVIEICRTDAASKEMALEVENGVAGKIVWADPARLRQVLWNVVKNAVQFTPRGGRIVLRTAGAVAPPGCGRYRRHRPGHRAVSNRAHLSTVSADRQALRRIGAGSGDLASARRVPGRDPHGFQRRFRQGFHVPNRIDRAFGNRASRVGGCRDPRSQRPEAACSFGRRPRRHAHRDEPVARGI